MMKEPGRSRQAAVEDGRPACGEVVVGLRGLYDEASSDDEVEVLLGDGEARLASAARKKAKESGRKMVSSRKRRL